MKIKPDRFLYAWAIVLMALSSPATAQEEGVPVKNPWLLTISSNYGKWSASDVTSDGNQALGLVQLSYSPGDWGAAVSGTYAKTSYKSATSENRFDVSTLADSDLSLFYMYKTGGLTLRGGLDARLPTGKHSFSTEQLATVMVDELNQELMLLNTYGGGLNIIPNLVAVFSVKPFTFGAGLRYELTGEYDPTTDTEGDNFNPGDRLLALVNGSFSFSDSDIVMLTLSYLNLTRDKQGGADVFRQGDTYSADMKYFRAWGDMFTSILGVTYKTQAKNESLSSESFLLSEASNSNNNILDIYANGTYRYSKEIAIQGVVGVKFVGANGYLEDDPLYDAGLDKIYVEPGVTWYFTESAYVSGKIRYSRIKNKKDALSEADAVYSLYNADVSFVYGF
ncbi:MAG: hypothetical protein HY751_11850 [Nitrospinae bacterium]|nr:hypothetical protein [Nitrospinota bacterium]